MAEKDAEVTAEAFDVEQMKSSKAKELFIQLMRKACLSAEKKISKKEFYSGADVIQLLETMVQLMESVMFRTTCGNLEEKIDVLMDKIEEAILDENIPSITSRSVFSNSKHEGVDLKIESEEEFPKLSRSTFPQESSITSKSFDLPSRPSYENISLEASEENDVSGNIFNPSQGLQSITKSGSIGYPMGQNIQSNSALNLEGCEKIGASHEDKTPTEDCVRNLSPEWKQIFLELDKMLAKKRNEISILSDLHEVSEKRRGSYEDLAEGNHASLLSESNESGEYLGYKFE